MPSTNLDLPTLKELFTRIRDDFDTHLPGEGAKIRRSFLWVVAAVLAGATHGVYRLLDKVARNLLIDRADDEAVILRTAGLYRIRRDPGEAASGTFRFSGTPGATVPAGTAFERDDGTEYTTDAVGTIGGGGTVDVVSTASEPGEAGNIDDASEELTISSAVAGVSSTVTVVVAASGGIDEESVESVRQRALEHMRTPPQGGAGVDYVARVKEAPGVSGDVARVWIGQEGGSNSVTVWFALEGNGADVIPTSDDVAAVGNYLDNLDDSGHSTWRPTTADVSVGAPVAEGFDIEVGISPHSADLAAIVEEELHEMFGTAGAVRRSDLTPSIRNAKIHEALVRTLSRGVDYYVLSSVGGGPASSDITPSAVGNLPILGTLTVNAL